MTHSSHDMRGGLRQDADPVLAQVGRPDRDFHAPILSEPL